MPFSTSSKVSLKFNQKDFIKASQNNIISIHTCERCASSMKSPSPVRRSTTVCQRRIEEADF